MLRKINPIDVTLGMYIAGFGGSWFDHPFWRSKFVIVTPSDLQRVHRSSVSYVLIDDELGKSAPSYATENLGKSSDIAPSATNAGSATKRVRRAVYKALGPDDTETASLVRAGKLAARSKEIMRSVFSDLKMGWTVSVDSVDSVMTDIADAVDQDAKALISVTRLKTKDDYTYLHSVAVCTLMICIARHRGLEEPEIRALGLAGLLHDVGKIGIPDPILNKPDRLTDPEFEIVRGHPRVGFQLLSESPGISDTALDVCLHHHEKMDGSGYPERLSGAGISFAARLGAVCDVFDALTSQRSYKEAWSSQKALTRMWSWDGHFDPELLQDLMMVLHIFAEGLLVKLSNGHLALTLNQVRAAQHVPVIEFYDTQAKVWLAPCKTQISKCAADCRILSIEDPAAWGFTDWETVRGELTGAKAAA